MAMARLIRFRCLTSASPGMTGPWCGYGTLPRASAPPCSSSSPVAPPPAHCWAVCLARCKRRRSPDPSGFGLHQRRPGSRYAPAFGGMAAAVRGRRFRLGGGVSLAGGEAIYERAQAVVAKVNGETVMAGAARCANCHGDLGEGRREGVLVAVPLQRSALMQSHSRRGGPASAYGRASFCRSLRSGVDPAGVVLDTAMPRYDLSDQSRASFWNFVIGR